MAGLSCANESAGIAQLCEKKYPVNVYKGMLLLVPGFTIASASALATETTMLGHIADGNVYPIQNLLNVENEDTEGNVEEASTQEKIFNYEGLRGSVYHVPLPLDSHKIARTYNNIDWTVIWIDLNGTFIFTQNTGGTIQGFSQNMLHFWPLPTPGSDVATKTRVQIQESDINELDKFGYYLNPTYNARKLFGPLDITLSNSVVATNQWTTTVLYQSSARYDNAGVLVQDDTAASGLAATDFEVYDQNNVLQVGGTDYTATEGAAGVYAFNGSAGAITSGRIRVKTSVKPLLKSDFVDLTT